MAKPPPPRPTIRIADHVVDLEDSAELTVERAKEILAAAQEKASECEEKVAETIALPDPELTTPLTKDEEVAKARAQHEVPEGVELTAAHVKAILSKTNRQIDGYSNATRHAFTPDSSSFKLRGRKKA